MVSALLKGNLLRQFFRFTGIIVLILAFFNISNAYNLLSLGVPQVQQKVDTSNLPAQEVRFTQDSNGYTPNTITIHPNSKIRLIITSKNPYTCASQLIIPTLGITKNLTLGENVVEFVSPASGEIDFSCSMGMYRGKFVVAVP